MAELHLGYEELEPYLLQFIETEGEPLSYVVEKIRLGKDKTTLKVNVALTLASIPLAVFDYSSAYAWRSNGPLTNTA